MTIVFKLSEVPDNHGNNEALNSSIDYLGFVLPAFYDKDRDYYYGIIDNNVIKGKTSETLVRNFKFWVERRIVRLAKGAAERLEKLEEEAKLDGNYETLTLTISGEEEPFDAEAYDYWMNNEIPVTCEEDMWHNLEVRHRKLQRAMKANNSTK